MDKIHNQLSINQVIVEKLFGFYNYKIPNKESDISKLLILYGDNGSGKTTVLRAIFYLLSTKINSGFKSKLAKIKFKRISVKLENGTEIGAFRDKKFTGDYTYFIKDKNKSLTKVLLKTDSEDDIRIGEQSKADQKSYESIIKQIRKLKIHTFFLTDDRRIHSSLTSIDEDLLNEIDHINPQINYKYRVDNNSNTRLKGKPKTLDYAFDRLANWIKNKTIDGSRIGEKNSQVIFSEIINNYITLSESEKIGKSAEELLKELKDIEKKIPSYVAFGLVEKFETKTIRSSIRKAKTPEQLKYIGSITTPFLEGINAKLSALEKLEQTITLFISIVNDYFSNKIISFNLNDGFEIIQNDNEPINYKLLSSGEKQLLLLLINTIISSDDATVFIIDEPEISLNVKWQRKLIDTLLTFSSNNNIQFILATHSFELLSTNRSNVSKLINIDD